MAQLNTAAEYDELYDSRRLKVMWRLSRSWTLLTASLRFEWMQVELFLRQDQPHAPAHIKKLSFRSEEECDAYLLAKKLELESEGWREEQDS
jgi:hypothetical protein